MISGGARPKRKEALTKLTMTLEKTKSLGWHVIHLTQAIYLAWHASQTLATLLSL
jgi:hypothetical protein